MAGGDSAGQKTEKPTRRRREQARQKGQVAYSAEVNNALVLLAAVGAFALFGGQALGVIVERVSGLLGALQVPTLDQTGTLNLLGACARDVLRAVLPLMLVTGVVGLLCSLAQTGVVVTPSKLAFDLKNLNPINGLRNMVSLTALMRLLVAAVKIGAIGLIVYLLVRSRLSWFTALTGKSAWGILYVSRRFCLTLMFRIALAMMVVAALDCVFQRWQFSKQLMMTKAELREEYKRDEGDPEVRARQEGVRRSMARRRMMQAVPDADVIVTNPTHVAVALRWDDSQMAAPRVVAKGKDVLARRIKQIAQQHSVPVVEREVLARALYEAVEVGMEIPPKLYYAVAEVLAFVMRGGRAA